MISNANISAATDEQCLSTTQWVQQYFRKFLQVPSFCFLQLANGETGVLTFMMYAGEHGRKLQIVIPITVKSLVKDFLELTRPKNMSNSLLWCYQYQAHMLPISTEVSPYKCKSVCFHKSVTVIFYDFPGTLRVQALPRICSS